MCNGLSGKETRENLAERFGLFFEKTTGNRHTTVVVSARFGARNWTYYHGFDQNPWSFIYTTTVLSKTVVVLALL